MRGRYVNLPTPDGVQRWRVATKKRLPDWGLTDWNTKTIWLAEGQTAAELTDTIIHEVLHVATGLGSDERIETVIKRAAAGATAVLLKCGLINEED